MRVKRTSASLSAALAILATFPALSAQESATDTTEDTPTAVQVAKRQRELNDVKLIAQQAALPALRGENKFILRESWWNGTLAPGKAKLIQVQLFSRNAYQFWLAVPNRDAGLNLNVYDGEGNLVPAESVSYEESNIVSLVVEPETTGVYYVRIGLKTTIDRDQDWAVIYAYK